MQQKITPKYFNGREHLYHASDGFLCHKGTFVVPKALRLTYLNRLLLMHQAASKMVQRASQSLRWPFMPRHARYVRISSNQMPLSQLNIMHQQNTCFSTYIHMDLGQWMVCYYLVVINQYSSFLHLVECRKTATTDQIVPKSQQDILSFWLFSLISD
jgi:hypothetical protein